MTTLLPCHGFWELCIKHIQEMTFAQSSQNQNRKWQILNQTQLNSERYQTTQAILNPEALENGPAETRELNPACRPSHEHNFGTCVPGHEKR